VLLQLVGAGSDSLVRVSVTGNIAAWVALLRVRQTLSSTRYRRKLVEALLFGDPSETAYFRWVQP
jgi:hypothetical protein